MTVIYGVILTAFFLPVVFVGREEGVGLDGCVVNLSEAETVGDGQGLTVDGGTADDVDVFVGSAMFQGFFYRRIDVAAFKSLCATAQDDIPAVGKGTLRQREVGVTTHDNRVTCGERLETL